MSPLEPDGQMGGSGFPRTQRPLCERPNDPGVGEGSRGIMRILPLMAIVVALASLPGEAPAQRRTGRLGPPARGSAGIQYLQEVERGIFRLTNAVRRKEGLPALTWDAALARVARSHSADMLVRGYFRHESPEGRTPHERAKDGTPYALAASGENLWGAQGDHPLEPERLPRIIVDTWLASPGHRANLLNPAFTDIGVGVAQKGNAIRATQVFARPR